MLNHLSNILEIRKIPSDITGKYFSHTIVNKNNIINCDTVSIVMTSADRSTQVYYTLKTISNSNYKNIQIIIVDDSKIDPVVIDKLKEFPFYIDFIEINKQNKIWQNPCINYNIAFEYIKGSKVIIQNSEVCHVGDVVSYLVNNIKSNDYHVYDVRKSKNFKTNDKIYNFDNIGQLDITIYQKPFFGIWYQHHTTYNRRYHFLVGMDFNAFRKIKGFSYDYSCVFCYDDDDFLLKIIATDLNIISISHENSKVGGIHLFHNASNGGSLCNGKQLLKLKTNYYNKHKEYIEISDSSDSDELLKRQNCLINNIKY